MWVGIEPSSHGKLIGQSQALRDCMAPFGDVAHVVTTHRSWALVFFESTESVNDAVAASNRGKTVLVPIETSSVDNPRLTLCKVRLRLSPTAHSTVAMTMRRRAIVLVAPSRCCDQTPR